MGCGPLSRCISKSRVRGDMRIRAAVRGATSGAALYFYAVAWGYSAPGSAFLLLLLLAFVIAILPLLTKKPTQRLFNIHRFKAFIQPRKRNVFS